MIVGSAVVKRLLDGKLEEAVQLIREMREALDKAYAARLERKGRTHHGAETIAGGVP